MRQCEADQVEERDHVQPQARLAMEPGFFGHGVILSKISTWESGIWTIEDRAPFEPFSRAARRLFASHGGAGAHVGIQRDSFVIARQPGARITRRRVSAEI
jgi:hypothetical protein